MNENALLAEIEAHAVVIAGKAGEILLSHFSKPIDVQFKGKGSRDPVTAADRASDEYLRAAIKDRFPEHGIVSEEGEAVSSSGSPYTWVLDPLDGTVNFMNGMPLFAVSVGVLCDGQPVAGSIYAPVTHKAVAGVYHARLGNGAWLDNERIDITRPSSGRPLAAMPAAGRFRLTGQGRKEPHETRSTGSIAVDLVFTASGIFQYALFGRPKIWDVAAGVLLVKEAGGAAVAKGKGQSWQPLDRFEPSADEKRILSALSGWSTPLLVGGPEVITRVARDIRGPSFQWSLLGWHRRDRLNRQRTNAVRAPRQTR